MTITWLVYNINQLGGVEQVICGLSNHFVNKFGYNVKIISIITYETNVLFPLDEKVTIEHCKQDYRTRTKKSTNNLIKKLLSELDTDILVTCHPGISNICAIHKRKLRGKLIITEHCNPLSYTKKRLALNSLFYRFADAFVNLTEHSRSVYKKHLCNSIVIPNAMLCSGLSRSSLTEKVVISAGRFEEVKGYDRLLAAFAIASEGYPNWKLCLCGDGSCADSLKKQAQSLGIKDKLILPGTVKMSEYYSKASVFALSSHYEAFPLVVVEALSCGLPVVAFDLPCLKEICEGKAALIAPQNDINTYAKHLKTLFGSQESLLRLSEEAFTISQKYSIDEVGNKWKALFEKLIKK
ncbi:MAG: glycosyltransferase [Clostridia bacterium]|nr:glycosyltransferase [Clostridia bacterium]